MAPLSMAESTFRREESPGRMTDSGPETKKNTDHEKEKHVLR